MAPVRVWVPGCSTGQEAFSMAISLVEFFDDKPIRPPIQIFATDISDPNSLEKARAGLYPDSIEAEVSPERLRRFFRKEDHMYRVDKHIRELCVFARQNVAADPPFSHLDLISCRNVLIYLATPLQKRVLPTFHYALRIPGFLVLGTAETVGENTDLFEMVDRANKIYVKKPAASRLELHFPAEDHRGGVESIMRRPVAPSPTPADFQREADRILLGRYAPPGVASWSMTISTSFNSAGEPAPIWSPRPESRPPICSRWRARDCFRSCAAPSLRLDGRIRRFAVRGYACAPTVGFATSIWRSSRSGRLASRNPAF